MDDGLSAEAREVAERRAAGDRDLLARLVAARKVLRRDGAYERAHPEVAGPFRRDIQARAEALRPRVNLAIRPKKKRKR